ncbi:MAG: tetratricopeptide repeat protein [bacterium]
MGDLITPIWPWVMGCLSVVGICLALASPAQAQNSDRRDSVTTATSAAWEPQDLNISRKVIPDVQATTLPKAAAPRRPPRLANPVDGAYQFHLAQKALASGNYELAHQKASSAASAYPGQSQYHWWQSMLNLRRLDPPNLLIALPDAVRASLADPLVRKRSLLLGHQASILYIALLWSLLVLAYLFWFWRQICHALVGFLFRERRHRLRSWLGLMLPLAVVLLRPGWIGGLALLSVPLFLQARGRQCVPLLVPWVLALLFFFPSWSFLQQAMPSIDPLSETSLLVAATQMPPSAHRTADIEQRLSQCLNPSRQIRLQLSLAIQEARNGNYQRSSQLFQRILDRDPQHVAAWIGLANNTYYLGQYDAAVHQYLAARKLAPEVGETSYNLAQVYFKKLFLPEAEEALKQARARGFDPPAWEDQTGEANGFSPVVYLGHTDDEIQTSCRWEAHRYPLQAHLAGWRFWFGSPPLRLFDLLAVSLALTLMLAWWQRRRPAHQFCQNCGWVICATCGQVRDSAWLCSTCAETADRAKSELVQATLLKNRSRSLEIVRIARRSLMGRLLPGAGHYPTGHLYGASIRLILLAGGLFMALFGWAFDLSTHWRSPGLLLAEETIHPLWYPLPLAAWPGFGAWQVLVGVGVIVALYVLAQLDGANLRHPDFNQVQLGEFGREANPACVSTARHGS